MDSAKTESISEEWLASVGFKWHQLERQPAKHWVLWLGGRDFYSRTKIWAWNCPPPSVRDGNWTCWLRSDFARRYHRFIFLRHLTERRELTSLICHVSIERLLLSHASNSLPHLSVFLLGR
jgi:hypothetical protein